MPGFQDSAFLIILALLLFGPKKLPQLARQAGKLMADFRRASNEFRTQMEEELRISEQADRQKQVAALEAAKPAAPAANPPEPSHSPELAASNESPDDFTPDSPHEYIPEPVQEPAAEAVPIATSGELSIMPPSTGLPIANSSPEPANSAGNAMPAEHAADPARESQLEAETLHG